MAPDWRSPQIVCPYDNLWNDVTAAKVVFRSKIELWQTPSTLYKRVAVSYAELVEKVYDKGHQENTWSDSWWNGIRTIILMVPSNTGRSGIPPAIGVMM